MDPARELESNPNILRGDEAIITREKRTDRPGEGRSADLVDVGLEGSGKEGRGHGGDLLEASGRVTGRRLGESSWGSGKLPFGGAGELLFWVLF